MPAHAYHEWPEGKPEPILFDDCDECRLRAHRPWDLDAELFERAWRLMVNSRSSRTVDGRTAILTAAEGELVDRLYLVAVLLERYMQIDPWRWPPTSAASGSRLSEILGRQTP